MNSSSASSVDWISGGIAKSIIFPSVYFWPGEHRTTYVDAYAEAHARDEAALVRRRGRCRRPHPRTTRPVGNASRGEISRPGIAPRHRRTRPRGARDRGHAVEDEP